MSFASVQPDTHVVVFDINIYLDVAALLGPPFTWAKFHDAATKHSDDPLPHRDDPRIDSLRALALCLSKRYAGHEPLEVWTSAHIDRLVVRKAGQPDDRSLPDEDRGLGWTATEAEDLQDDLIAGLVYDLTSGGTVGEVGIAEGSPPLSNEDGRVLRTAVEVDTDHAVRYCITQDRKFRRCGPQLLVNVQVLNAHEWVELVRKSRRMFAMSRFPSGA